MTNHLSKNLFFPIVMRIRLHLFIGLLAILVACPAATLLAQGRWEFSTGVFGNAVDTAATTGQMVQFTRWPGEARNFQHGFRVSYLRGRQDLVNYPPAAGSSFNVTDEHQMWLMQLGAPFRAAPNSWPIRPFLDAEPAGMIYRSHTLTRYDQPYPHKIGIVDKSKWLLAPSVTFGVGLELPGRTGPRLQVRGDYRMGWLIGRQAEGGDAHGIWQAWSLGAGASFRY